MAKFFEGGNSPKNFFLKQYLTSNYCAVYSTGMFISMITGKVVSRSMAHRLFDVRRFRPYGQTTEEKILEVIKFLIPSFNGKWKTFSGENPIRSFSKFAKSGRRVPTIIIFVAKLNGYRQICGHSVIVTRIEKSVFCIDPLGKKPQVDKLCNLSFSIPKGQVLLSVEGGNYKIDNRYELSMLCWDPESVQVYPGYNGL